VERKTIAEVETGIQDRTLHAFCLCCTGCRRQGEGKTEEIMKEKSK
jgi:hypothetical protein